MTDNELHENSKDAALTADMKERGESLPIREVQ